MLSSAKIGERGADRRAKSVKDVRRRLMRFRPDAID